VDENDRDQHDAGERLPVNPPAAWRGRRGPSEPEEKEEAGEPSAGAESPVDRSAPPEASPGSPGSSGRDAADEDAPDAHEFDPFRDWFDFPGEASGEEAIGGEATAPPVSPEDTGPRTGRPPGHPFTRPDESPDRGTEPGPTYYRRRTDPQPPPPERIDELDALRDHVANEPVVLVVPPEIFVHFYPASPDQVLNALAKAGFDQVYFETLGDELVALAYLRLWRDNREHRTWIRSTNPLVVEYCREKHPELLPYLAPIVPPATALARYLRAVGETRPLLYAGLDFPEVNGERHFAAAVSFRELERFLEERDCRPVDQSPLLRTIPPERRRFLSAAGGLPLAMLDEERQSSRYFRRLRGLHYLGAVARLVDNDGTHLGFIDILPFDGSLDHPALGRTDDLYWRRDIMDLAEPAPAEGPVIQEPPGLDLSIMHRPKPSRLPHAAVAEIERALEDVRDQANGGDRFEAATDVAGYLSLTESLVRNRPDLAMGLLDMSRNYFRALRDATHDHLTDLYSYRALLQRAREELGQANRSGSKLALLFVDLDGFKEVNDEFGHATGNAVLRGVARAIEMSVRSTDIAGRYGGDEFVLVLVDADYEGALRVAEEVRSRIADFAVAVGEHAVGVTASIGIAFHAGSKDSLVAADDLFAEADAALYIAKAHGGNRVYPGVGEGSS